VKLDDSSEWSLLTPEQQERLVHFEHLLTRHAGNHGLLGPADLGRIHERHVLDSLRVLSCVRSAGDRAMVDMGSGAGLPGVPLAVAFPEAWVALVEPTRRRVAFLELAVQELGLRNTEVVPGTMAQFAERRHLVDVCLGSGLRVTERVLDGGRSRAETGGEGAVLCGPFVERSLFGPPAGVRAGICAPSRGPGIGPIVALFEIDPARSNQTDPDALT
jgi:16S rRNA (guanine(527)-N(7))-methyltransferase RsmG